MITLSDVSMRYGARVLFERVTWRLAPGVHYGLVGANGSGKSTLLKLMAGQLSAEGGSISRPNGLRLGVLPQDSAEYDGDALLDVVLRGSPRLWAALRARDALLAAPQAADAEAHGVRLAELEAVIADEDGYGAPAQAARLLEGLGIPTERHGRPMAELSGGFRLRVLLAQTLFQQAELLLLDEPTNHLDIVSIRWLEGYLREYPGTFVVVSHDRHFLNSVCNHIADLDYEELRLYPGDYARFEAAKELEKSQRETETGRLEKKIAETERFIERFKAKATKARQAGSRQKLVEKLEQGIPTIKISSRRYPRFQFRAIRPSGKEVLAVRELTKGYDGRPVIRGLGFELMRGQRLAVVGPNGIGKSTLLGMIAGTLEPDRGDIRHGHEVRLGYFGQEHRFPDGGKTTLLDWLYEAAPGEPVSTIRGMLGRVLFSGDDADKSVRALSGGEAARLLLARLMLKRDNLLVLDEPTNHLDLEGRQALLDALRGYDGTLIFVSHDRHFVSSLADRVLALAPGRAEVFAGGYEEYLAKEGTDYLDVKSAAPTRLARGQAGPGAPASGAAGFSARKAQRREAARIARRVQQLEKEIHTLEAAIAEYQRQFAEPGYFQSRPWDEVAAAEREKAATEADLERKFSEWQDLSAQIEGEGEAS